MEKESKPILKKIKLNPIPFILGLLWLVFSFYPIVYLFMTSLRSQEGFLTDSPWLPPKNPTLENYTNIFKEGILKFFLNSLIVSIVSVLIIILITVACSYVIVRTKTKLVQTTFKVLLIGLAIPVQAAIIPVYILIIKLGLYDTLIGLILPSVAFLVPLTTLILVNFIRDIPNSLYESMQLDGISHFGLLKHLVFPLSKPAIMTVAIYDFVQVWNNFLFPLVLTQSEDKQLLPLAIVSFKGEFSINVPLLMAAVMVSGLPLILLYIFGRKYLLKGLTAGFSK